MFGSRIELKSDDEIRLMRQAGLVVARVHQEVRAAVRSGVTTADLNQVAADTIEKSGATPNFLNYHGFPGVICTSVNHQIVHAIPGDQVLEPGDLLSVDAGAIVQGWHGDAAFSLVVDGEDDDAPIIEATRNAMWSGIAAFANATRVGDIGRAIESEVAGEYGIVVEYTGHGIGSAMHQEPDVFNVAQTYRSPRVRNGMCLAIEPLLTEGDPANRILSDEWTVVTTDGSRAAHFEHSVARHAGGIWVLTAPDGGAAGLRPHGITPVPLED